MHYIINLFGNNFWASLIYVWTHQVREVISILSCHESWGVAEACDVLDVGLQSWRVCFQYDIDEGGQEVVCRSWLVLSDSDGIEDMLAATGDARQFIPGHTLGVHLNDICGMTNP